MRISQVIILTGIAGSGKSTIANELVRYGYTFVQIDDFYQRTPRVNNAVEWWLDVDWIEKGRAEIAKKSSLCSVSGLICVV